MEFELNTKRQSTYNPADLNNASYLTFSFAPTSTTAKSFGLKLASQFLDSNSKASNRGRPIKIDGVAIAAVAIVAEVLDATRGQLERSVYHGLSPNHFTGKSISSRQFTRVMQGLEGLKLLKKTKGHWNKKSMFEDVATPTSGFGKATRWQATQKLFDLSKSNGITHKNIDEHFQIQPLKEVLILRKSSRLVNGRKVKGPQVKFPETKMTQRLEAEVKEINEFLRGHKIDGATHRGYRRIFNQGDNPKTYAWNKGGRLYGSGAETDYLTVQKEKRRKMQIDGEPTVEIDIRASFLTIFHGIHGVALDVQQDPYKVQGLPREIVKKWVVIAFGSGKPPARWSVNAGKDYFETSKTGRMLGQDYPIKVVTEKILTAIPVLKKLQAGDGFTLMNIESNAVVASILRLLREDRVPAYSVHDCLMVKSDDRELAMKALAEEYQKSANIIPHLKVV